jgi:hypothetical protein
MAGGAFLGAVLCGLSALHGFEATARCDAVQRDHDRCAAGDVATCRRLDASWMPPGARTRTPAPPCGRDVDCPGARICVGGACIEPAADAPPAVPFTGGGQ